MDYLRTAYVTKMRLWADKPDETIVRWFRCDPGAEVFPGPHSFTSRRNLDTKPAAPIFPIGESQSPGAWDPGWNLAGLAGKKFCGRPEAFVTGGVTALDPEIPVLPDGSSACCGALDELDPEELRIGDTDRDGSIDEDRISTGGEDDEVAKTPFRGGPKALLAPPNSTSQVGLAGLVLECITFSNIDTSDHTVRMAFGSLTGDENYVLMDVVVPANGWIRWPCMVPLTSGIILMQADVDDVVNYMGVGWIYS